MNRIEKTLVLIAAIALPAAAHSTLMPKPLSCFASGSATYRIAHGVSTPDFRIKIAHEIAQPDLRMQLVDRAEIADFVLVDDFAATAQGACHSATPVRTVTIDRDGSSPDVSVHLSADADPADYKIYVHSTRFSQQDAAALLAAIWKSNQRREMAAQFNR